MSLSINWWWSYPKVPPIIGRTIDLSTWEVYGRIKLTIITYDPTYRTWEQAKIFNEILNGNFIIIYTTCPILITDIWPHKM